MTEDLKQITIYTDGGAEPNPGPGGYGVVLLYEHHRKELSGQFRQTTNNRMEVLAAIAGLEALKEPCKVTLYSDSKYLVDAMTKGWVQRWQTNDWWRNKKHKAINIDLWERLLSLCDTHQVAFVWVKGHAGNRENERCDQLSMQFKGKVDLPVDEGYEQRPETETTEQIKITREGQPCRKCSTPVIKKTPRQRLKPNQQYYYEYYLYCPDCQTTYTVEEAKRYVT